MITDKGTAWSINCGHIAHHVHRDFPVSRHHRCCATYHRPCATVNFCQRNKVEIRLREFPRHRCTSTSTGASWRTTGNAIQLEHAMRGNMASMDNLTADQAARLLGDVIKPHVAILLFVGTNSSGVQVPVNNATASFIATGSENLIVTCAHVVHYFQKKCGSDAELFMAIGGEGRSGVLEIKQEWLVDCFGYEGTNLKIDLATYRLPGVGALAAIGKRCFVTECWPPLKAREGELAVIAGFPGVHRQQFPGRMIANMNLIADPITSVRDTYFTLADENQERTLIKLNESLGSLGSFGGMSGSAAYVFDSEGTPRLVGFLHEAHEGVNALIRVTHASFIMEDGKLDRSLLPL